MSAELFMFKLNARMRWLTFDISYNYSYGWCSGEADFY